MPNRGNTEIIRRIHRAGYLRELDHAPHSNLPKLEIENNPYESFAFVFYGGMGVILDLRITSDREVHMRDFGDLKLEENWCNVAWLETEKDVYHFYRGPEYPRDVVLNHRIGEDGIVKPGQPLEGVLMGWSTRPMPSQYSHGFKMSLGLLVRDEFDWPHPAELLVQVDENLCSKIRRPNRAPLYAPPWTRNKPNLVDEVEYLVPRREQADSDVSQVDAAEQRPGATPLAQA